MNQIALPVAIQGQWKNDDEIYCEYCPITWRRGDNYCDTPGTLYYRWKSEKSVAKRKNLAAKIRDLEWIKRKV